jgi:type III pantothenate kinase
MPLAWYIGSVNRPSATRLLDWLRCRRPQDRLTLLAAGDLPLEVRVPRPDMVGVDRLLDALAANALRGPGRPAVVIDVGTAITVDLVSAEGAFLGGAILPGIAMSARALHEFTDLLPLLDLSELAAPPPALGTETAAALRAGLFWGAVGGVRELIGQLAGPQRPQVILTGGASPAVAELLGPSAQLVPHLTLAGIALAARTLS